jgi:predicted ATPase/Tfp pilus assembly protein PilF
LAGAVGLTVSGPVEPKQQLLSFLETKTLLLLLDNFEHLVEEAGLLAEILQAAAGVTILVTSRVRLNIYEEWSFDVRGLQAPGESAGEDIWRYSAAQLFVQRAERIHRDFEREAHAVDIARICSLLAGMPLAIELAAGWVRTYTCREIASEIQRNLDFLTTNLRNVPARHRSMHAAFEHSWQLIPAVDRAAFAALSVFHGTFVRQAAEQVTGVTTLSLRRLTDATMLHIHSDGRYHVHELLRQFGADKLDRQGGDDIRQRHSLFYATFVQQRRPHRLTAQEPAALREIAAEQENIRAGWRWAVSKVAILTHNTAALEVFSAATTMLSYFYEIRSRLHDGMNLFRQTAAVMEEAGWAAEARAGQVNVEYQLAYAQVRLGEARQRFGLGHFAEVEQILARVLPIFRANDQALAAGDALALLGRTHSQMGKYDVAEHELQESLRWFQTSDAQVDRTEALNFLAANAMYQARFDDAQKLFEECLAIFEGTGYVRGKARLLNNLGTNYLRRGDRHQAKTHYDRAFAIVQQSDDVLIRTVILSNLGYIARVLGQYAESVRHYEESLTQFRATGDQRWTATCLNGLGLAYIDAGKPAAAKPCLREALDLGLATQSLADTVESIAGLAELLAADDQTRVDALVAISFVIHHPVTSVMARRRSEQIAEQLHAQMPPVQWQAAIAWGKAQSLDQVVAALKAQFPL